QFASACGAAPVDPARAVAGLKRAQAMEVGLGGRMPARQRPCLPDRRAVLSQEAAKVAAAERAELRQHDELFLLDNGLPRVGRPERIAAANDKRPQPVSAAAWEDDLHWPLYRLPTRNLGDEADVSLLPKLQAAQGSRSAIANFQQHRLRGVGEKVPF